jgi:hypothetical protein
VTDDHTRGRWNLGLVPTVGSLGLILHFAYCFFEMYLAIWDSETLFLESNAPRMLSDLQRKRRLLITSGTGSIYLEGSSGI